MITEFGSTLHPHLETIFTKLLYLSVRLVSTWSSFEAAKTAPWPSRGLHHCGKFLEPSDE